MLLHNYWNRKLQKTINILVIKLRVA